jgi:trehalose 6-phosphate phosphatase
VATPSPEQLDVIRAVPLRSGILVDFDGTLAHIVDDPAAARPVAGAAELLGELAARYRLVAVLSGRPVSFLQSVLPASILLSGLYGLEVARGGERVDHPLAGSWREVIEDVTMLAEARGPEGMRVEPKGLSLTLHYRTRPDLEDAVHEWARRQASRSGLVARPAKMSVELHPPIEADKGTAVEQLAEGLAAVCFVGDDVGDLPAFAALGRLAERGVSVLRVAVDGPECPAELIAEADATVDGPDGALALLRSLLDPA